MTVTQVSYPVAPTVTRLDGTLLDVATVQDGIAWVDENGLFASYNCMSFDARADFCPPAPVQKDLSQSIGWQDGIRFAAYGGVTCKAIGLDQDEMRREVGRVFESGESSAVERALMEFRFRADPGSRWAAPVDLTPAGGAVKPGVGVSILEGYAASVYVGAPTIHMPRVIASLLLGVDGAELSGRALRTKLGSKIAAGAGYDYPNTGPAGTEPAAGEKWLYASGEVVVLRGDTNIRQSMNTDNNDVVALGERGYVAAVDCFTAAVRVQVTA